MARRVTTWPDTLVTAPVADLFGLSYKADFAYVAPFSAKSKMSKLRRTPVAARSL
jgi:hypothetical protein